MTAVHRVPGGKRALAEHLHEGHQRGDRWIRSVLPVAVMARWTKDELDATHREHHEPEPPR